MKPLQRRITRESFGERPPLENVSLMEMIQRVESRGRYQRSLALPVVT